MGSDFHATIKLITGEEIFALVSVDNTEEQPVIIMQNPVIMKVLSTGRGQMMKIRPWLEVPGDDVYIIKYDRIITMSEINDKQTIHFYERYLNESEDNDLEFDGRVKLNTKLGFVATVDDARISLERIYNDNIKES